MAIIIKKIFLGLIFLLTLNCTNKKNFVRNIEDETSFKKELLSSIDKEFVVAGNLFKEEEVFYVFPPYYSLNNINEKIDNFSETFYYKERKKGNYIDVAEGIYLIISTKKGNIKKCMPIERKLFSFERLKNNEFKVKKTDFILKKLDDGMVEIELFVRNSY